MANVNSVRARFAGVRIRWREFGVRRVVRRDRNDESMSYTHE